MNDKRYFEDLDPEKLKGVEYWLVTEDDPDEVNLSAITVDEAIEEWKESIDDDPEAVFASKEAWETYKKDPTVRISVTAYKKIEHPAPSADYILDDVITNMEENDQCFQDNCYRSNKRMLEAAEAFKKVIEEEVDSYYYPAFDVLCYMNKKNDLRN